MCVCVCVCAVSYTHLQRLDVLGSQDLRNEGLNPGTQTIGKGRVRGHFLSRWRLRRGRGHSIHDSIIGPRFRFRLPRLFGSWGRCWLGCSGLELRENGGRCLFLLWRGLLSRRGQRRERCIGGGGYRITERSGRRWTGRGGLLRLQAQTR